jgi:hypothetical protein
MRSRLASTRLHPKVLRIVLTDSWSKVLHLIFIHLPLPDHLGLLRMILTSAFCLRTSPADYEHPVPPALFVAHILPTVG